MFVSYVFLRCNECNAPFPAFDVAVDPLTPLLQDGAIFTPRVLRSEARKLGWQHYGGSDYCPTCELPHRAEALVAKGGRR